MDVLASPVDVGTNLLPILVTIVVATLSYLIQRIVGRAQDRGNIGPTRARHHIDRNAADLATRLTGAVEKLKESARLTQELTGELEAFVREQSVAATMAAFHLERMTEEEQATQERLERLKAVEPEAAKELASVVGKLMAADEKRGRRRDYGLFLAGVVASGVVSIVLTEVFHI